MSFTLQEILDQIDPFVTLSDGFSSRTVIEWLERVDLADTSEYILTADPRGRLLITQLDFEGYPILPPAFVEDKRPAPRSRVATYRPEFFPKLASH
jgi:hypothetical protein